MKENNHRRHVTSNQYHPFPQQLFGNGGYAVLWSTAMSGAKSTGPEEASKHEKPTNNRKIDEIKSFSICAVGRLSRSPLLFRSLSLSAVFNAPVSG